MNKRLPKNLAMSIIFLLLASASAFSCTAAQPSTDIVIYGGGYAACAAATSAAEINPRQEITMIVPYPEDNLGGIGTVGGQNFMDLRFWNNEFVTKGSLYRWYQKLGRFYNTEELAAEMNTEIESYPHLTVIYGKDIQSTSIQNQEIKSISLRPVQKTQNGCTSWTGEDHQLSARVFIDASENGRLARLAGISASLGRQDWPLDLLPPGEVKEPPARQQAATLMFKVRGVELPPGQRIISGWQFVKDHTGSWGLAGGVDVFETDPVLKEFNRKYGPQGFALKPLNAAQDGSHSNEWWVNALLIFDVDARAREMDRGTENFPEDMMPGSLSMEEAWQKAKEFIAAPEFLQALRRFQVYDQKTSAFYGFQKAELVRDHKGEPVTGKVLYIRETIHSTKNTGAPGYGGEDSNYHLTPVMCQQAGENSQSGADAQNYTERIGLAHYFMDVNAYTYEDLIAAGDFRWPVTEYVRPQWAKEGGQPKHPVYLPYRMLTSPDVNNLLLPGYASSSSSLAWSQIRVLPNLAVLGDAAGAAAAISLQEKIAPGKFKQEQVRLVQEKLRQINARLDK